jgi:TolA-binding protein
VLEDVRVRMEAIKHILDALPLKGVGQEVFELHSSLNQIMLLTSILESNRYSNEECREAIAKIRAQIHQMTERLEELQTLVAVEYRNRVGNEKELFEKLTDGQQIESNALAYESRGTFQALVKMGDVLSLLSSYLMDRSADLENIIQASKESKEVGHVETYDKDPAPPSLSP